MKPKIICVMGINPLGHNRGLVAMSMSMLDMLKKHFPNDKIYIIPFFSYSNTNFSSYDRKYGSDKNVKILKLERRSSILPFLLDFTFRSSAVILWKILKYLKIDITPLLVRDEILQAYIRADIVISHTAGDCLSDRKVYAYHLIAMSEYLVPILLNKPIILSPQTIEPFNTQVGRLIAKWIFKNVQICCVREKNSFNYLKDEMKIDTKKIILLPDLAFAFQPSANDDINNALKENRININTSQLWIGISLRHLVKENYVSVFKHQEYVKCMAKVIDYLIEKYNASIIIVPHAGMKKPYKHLKQVTDEVINRVSHKEKVYSIEKKEYPAEVLKGIIGRCNLFIGAFMHANIAALSMCVPTVGLSYGWKFEGIMESVNMEKFVCNLLDINCEELISKVEEVLSKRKKIQTELKKKNDEIKKELLLFPQIVEKEMNVKNGSAK